MKKKSKPLGKVNEAIRKAESKELFQTMLKSKHTIVTPATRKGTRSVNKRHAIAESL